MKKDLLALGIDEKIQKDLRPQESSLAIQKNNGMSIVAHPDGEYQFHFRKRNYSWKYWDLKSCCHLSMPLHIRPAPNQVKSHS